MQEHKKIAVTEATGRVGRHIVEVLRGGDNDVVRSLARRRRRRQR